MDSTEWVLRMRFQLIDRVDAWEPGKSLRGSKFLALGEEYLADHFPQFPVMPGVLMLHVLVEAGAWLWRQTTEFGHAIIVLRTVRNVKYGTFMQPGRRMDVAVDMVKQDGDTANFKGKGTDDAGQQTVSAAFTLCGYNLASRNPAGIATDARIIGDLKARWPVLTGVFRGN
ncbi:MAG TPA: hydroxymyristoyl-ACP dehydratase [Fimbriiglobus sp.]